MHCPDFGHMWGNQLIITSARADVKWEGVNLDFEFCVAGAPTEELAFRKGEHPGCIVPTTRHLIIFHFGFALRV